MNPTTGLTQEQTDRLTQEMKNRGIPDDQIARYVATKSVEKAGGLNKAKYDLAESLNKQKYQNEAPVSGAVRSFIRGEQPGVIRSFAGEMAGAIGRGVEKPFRNLTLGSGYGLGQVGGILFGDDETKQRLSKEFNAGYNPFMSDDYRKAIYNTEKKDVTANSLDVAKEGAQAGLSLIPYLLPGGATLKAKTALGAVAGGSAALAEDDATPGSVLFSAAAGGASAAMIHGISKAFQKVFGTGAKGSSHLSNLAKMKKDNPAMYDKLMAQKMNTDYPNYLAKLNAADDWTTTDILLMDSLADTWDDPIFRQHQKIPGYQELAKELYKGQTKATEGAITEFGKGLEAKGERLKHHGIYKQLGAKPRLNEGGFELFDDMAEAGIRTDSIDTVIDDAGNMFQQYQGVIPNLTSYLDKQGRKMSVQPMLDYLDDAINTQSSSLTKEPLMKVKLQLIKDLGGQLDDATGKMIGGRTEVPFKDFYALKQAYGGAGSWNKFQPATDQEVAKAFNKVYVKMNDQLDDALTKAGAQGGGMNVAATTFREANKQIHTATRALQYANRVDATKLERLPLNVVDMIAGGGLYAITANPVMAIAGMAAPRALSSNMAYKAAGNLAEKTGQFINSPLMKGSREFIGKAAQKAEPILQKMVQVTAGRESPTVQPAPTSLPPVDQMNFNNPQQPSPFKELIDKQTPSPTSLNASGNLMASATPGGGGSVLGDQTQNQITIPDGTGGSITVDKSQLKISREQLIQAINADPKHADLYITLYQIANDPNYGLPEPKDTGGSKESAQRINNATAALKSLDDVEKIVDKEWDAGLPYKRLVPGQFFTRDYEAAATNAADLILRMRTGAQANEQEIRLYRDQIMPAFGDSKDVALYKIRNLKAELQRVASSQQTSAMTPEDLVNSGVLQFNQGGY